MAEFAEELICIRGSTWISYEAAVRGDEQRVASLQSAVMTISNGVYSAGEEESSYLRGLKCAASMLGFGNGLMAEPYFALKARGARRHPRCTGRGGSTESHGDSMNKFLLSIFLVGACALSADPMQNVVVYKEAGSFWGLAGKQRDLDLGR